MELPCSILEDLLNRFWMDLSNLLLLAGLLASQGELIFLLKEASQKTAGKLKEGWEAKTTLGS